MLLTRRRAVAGCCGTLGCGAFSVLAKLPTLAEAGCPARAIKVIVPFPAGGTIDFLGRLIAGRSLGCHRAEFGRRAGMSEMLPRLNADCGLSDA